MSRRSWQVSLLSLVAMGALLLGAASASAATRYAAPGGTGADPCASEASPCSVYTAADVNAPGTTIGTGDVVEMEPGTYSDAAGDLGATGVVQPPTGVTVRGQPGRARPLIKLEVNTGFWGAFILFGGKVAGVEIVNEGPGGSAISLVLQAATVERVVARSTAASSITCAVDEGLLRDSVCLNEAGGIAVGASLSASAGTHPATLRNVTAIGSGSGSVGLDFGYFGGGVVGAVSGKSVIARGEAKDVIARGVSLSGNPGTGASVSIALDHSDYATTETKTSGGGSASVTAAGSGTNITAPPLLAADGYHQLVGSPTLDKGATDGSSGATDVDGQLRTIGTAVDIGADELGHPTATTISCPASALFSSPLSEAVFCTATVADSSSSGSTAPGGIVKFDAGGGVHDGFCTLASLTASSSSCQMSYAPTPSSLGPHAVTATYNGDVSHDASVGSTTITVVEKSAGTASSGADGSGDAGNVPPVRKVPSTQLGRHPARRTTKRSAKFTFTADQVGATFQCKLDKASFKPCSSPFKRRLAPGHHVFRVRAADSKGAFDATPAVFHWQILADD